jgi:hypothetical protein
MMLPDLVDIEKESDYAKCRIYWAGEDRRQFDEWWVDALECLAKTLREYEEHPVEVNQMRAEAAVREAKRIAQVTVWSVVGGIISCLQEGSGAWNDTGLGGSFASWAANNPGRKILLKSNGEDGIEISPCGTKVSVWATAPPVGRKEPPDFVFDTISLDQLGDWEPPELPGPDRRDLALLGKLTESELVELAATDPVVAVCAPNATLEVLRAVGAQVDVDPRHGDIELIVDGMSFTIGKFDVNMFFLDIIDTIREIVPCSTVTVTCAMLDTGIEPGVASVDLYANDELTREVGTFPITDETDAGAEATRLLDDNGIDYPGWEPDWEYAGYSSYGSCFTALLDVEVTV